MHELPHQISYLLPIPDRMEFIYHLKDGSKVTLIMKGSDMGNFHTTAYLTDEQIKLLTDRGIFERPIDL